MKRSGFITWDSPLTGRSRREFCIWCNQKRRLRPKGFPFFTPLGPGTSEDKLLARVFECEVCGWLTEIRFGEQAELELELVGETE